MKKPEDFSFIDAFNNDYLELVPPSSYDTTSVEFEIGGNDFPWSWNTNGSHIQWEQLDDGTIHFYANSIPLKKNGSPYGYYRITYYLTVKDQEAFEKLQSQAIANGGKYTLKNTAVWGNLPSECEVEFKSSPVTKEGYFASNDSDERKYTFVIDVNPKRYTLSGDGSETIELTDEHSQNLTVDYSSVKIYKIPSEAGDIGNTKAAYQANMLNDYLCPRGSISWNFSGNDGIFYLNDQTHYVVVYDAIVIGSGPQPFSNIAELEGFIATHNNSKTYSGEAHGSGEIWEINLLKYKDGMTSNGLEGATFQLFRGTGEYIQVSDDQGNTRWEEQKEPMKYGDTDWTRDQGLVGKDITFTTGSDGTATIRLEQPIHGNEIEGNVHYFLKEIDSPPGYQIDSSVEYWAFTLTKDSDEVNYGDKNRKDEYGNLQWIYFYYNDILKMANTETTEPLDVEVKKSWYDEDGKPITGENLDESFVATIQLMRKTDEGDYKPVKVEYDQDGKPSITEVETSTDDSRTKLEKTNNWSYTWNQLPRVEMGGQQGLEIIHRYAYKVEEVELDGYIVAVEETENKTTKTYALKNYKKPGRKDTEVTVEKIWQDSDGEVIETVDNLPEEINFYLYQVISTTPFTTPPRSGGTKYIISEDDRLVDSTADPESENYGLYKAVKSDDWSTTFEDLPEIRTDEDGTTFYYGYYVRELPLEGYTITYKYNSRTRTIVNKAPLSPDNKFINIGLEKEWAAGDSTTPPANAQATFTVHQLKATKTDSSGIYDVILVGPDRDDWSNPISTRKANVGDSISFSGIISASQDSNIYMRRNNQNNPWRFLQNLHTASEGAFSSSSYIIQESDVVDGCVVVSIASSDFLDSCTEAPHWDAGEPSWTDYEPTSYTRTVTLPTTGRSWSTTISNLIREDSDGNLYKYYITEDSCTPAVTNVSFVDQNGNNIKDQTAEDVNQTTASLDTTGQKVKVTNTYIPVGSLEITKNIRTNGGTDSTKTGTFSYSVYKAADVGEDGRPKANAEATATGQIDVSEGGQKTVTVSDLPYGTYYVYELDEDNAPIVSGSGGALALINGLTYNVIGSGTSATVGEAAPATESGDGASTSAGNEVTLINEITDFEFTKIWKDASLNNADWPDDQEITVTVSRKISQSGEPETVGTYTIKKTADGFTITKQPDQATTPDLENKAGTAEKEYTFLIRNLPVGNDTGEYTYFVTEAALSGYSTRYETQSAVTSGEGITSPEYALNGGTIINTPEGGYELPRTGGIGTTLFTVSGGLMTAMAGVFLALRRKRRIV